MNDRPDHRAPTRPLAGFRILDFTHAAAGPFATRWLADYGADVIKIEKPGRGDGARFMGEPMHGPKDSDYFVGLNSGKRSLALDLGRAEAVELAKRLVATSDIVVSNFRPGVMERLGLGFDDLKGLRESLIVCSISAFGKQSDWAGRPANDIIVQAMSGLMDITGEPDGDPVKVGAPISDYATGLFALSGILAALACRGQYPEGQHVEVNMFDSTVALMANYLPGVLDLGKSVPRLGRGHPQIVPYQAFKCSDGDFIMLGAFTSGFWRRLAKALDREEWITDSRFESNAARVTNRAILVPLIEELLAEKDRESWSAVMAEYDVPFAPINSVKDALASDVAATSTMLVSGADGRTAHVGANPVRVEAWPTPSTQVSPTLGSDTEDILEHELGLSKAQISELTTSGAAGRGPHD